MLADGDIVEDCNVGFDDAVGSDGCSGVDLYVGVDVDFASDGGGVA